ncbi:endonuclease domain-containing protein [Micromonospora ureilytica]|uniref:endonuclease domain-containing protein n=1 Tax=Micromonospora ureilytica TaxID=709868 RepID=UPI002E135D9E|nr:endonuclease domain-containing protein [Micromonospora ureilytica]
MSLRRTSSPADWGRRLPSDDADELTWLLFHQEDVVSLDQARHHLSTKAIRHRVATGTWRQIHRAVFVAHNGPVTAGQLRWAAVLAAGPQAILGGLTAAQAGGLRGFPGRPIHILLPASCRRGSLPAGVLAHRTVTLRDQDVLAVGQPRRTRAARSIVDAAQWSGDDQQARSIVAAAFQQRIVAGDDLNRVVERLPRVRRRQLVLAAAADAAGGAHSVAELDFLRLIRRAGLPEPARQKIRYDSTGRRRYLDAYFEHWRVHVEIDGGQHVDPQAWWADMRRQNDLWIEGDRVLRFPAWAIRTHPDEVLTQLRAALGAAGWQG